MNVHCPKCGGSSLWQITPGYFECTNLVVVGIIHRPDGMGPMPAEHRCGHRFQVGVTASTELCQCGRQSIGKCADCARPLCGMDGTTSGPFLCTNCVNQRYERRRNEERATAEQQQAAAVLKLAEAERGRAAMTAKLASAQSLDEVVMLIIQNDVDIPDDACKAAWLQLVANRIIEPTHHIVTAAGRRHLLYEPTDPGTGWREVSRSDAWWARGVIQGDGEPSDRWLDSDGAMWAAASSQDLHLYPDWTPSTYPFTRGARGEPNWVALPKGEAFRTDLRPGRDQRAGRGRQSQWSYVAGGVRLSRQPADNDFTKVAAAILRTR